MTNPARSGYGVYVHLTDPAITPVATTRGVHEQVNLDYDAAGSLVGVEVLGGRLVVVDGVAATDWLAAT